MKTQKMGDFMHEGHRERVREKYIEYGIDALCDHEVLELILFYSIPRGDTNALAHLLLEEFGGNITSVFDADVRDLCAVPGIGEKSAVLIKLISELFNYYHKSKWQGGIYLSCANAVGEYVADVLGNSSQELFYVLCFDVRKKLIVMQKVEEGTVADVGVSIRKVAECAIRNRAHSIVLAHNHPSGSLIPSDGDINITKTLVNAFKALDIPVLDHISVSGKGFTSMAQAGLMP